MGHDVVITAHDGERLAGTLYLPSGDGPFAAVMEALPYRKDDVTESYRPTYERYAAHGLAVLRLDLRGTGSSTGIADRRVPRRRAQRPAHGDRVARRAAVVERSGGDVRHVVLGLQLAADGGRGRAGAAGGRGHLRHRRPLHRRRPLLRRRAAGDRPHRLPALHGRDERAAAGARGVRRRLARRVAATRRAHPAVVARVARTTRPTARRGGAARSGSGPTAPATSGWRARRC